MSESNRTIQFPRLTDSEIETGVITLNNNFQNEKEKTIKVTLHINENNAETGLNEQRQMKFYCEPSTAANLNYKIKSSLNQIEEVIKYISQK
jgi:hypothetical protein